MSDDDAFVPADPGGSTDEDGGDEAGERLDAPEPTPEPADSADDDEPDDRPSLTEKLVDAYHDRAGDKPDRPSVADSNISGAQLGDAIGSALGGFALNTSMLVSKLMPGSQRMWKGMLKASYKGVYKSDSDIDAIGHIMVGGEIKHVPVTYDHEAEQYQTLADDPEWWDTHGTTEDQYRVGPVPAVWASSAANDLGSAVQADVAEAIDVGKEGYVYQDAKINHVQMLSPDAAGVNDEAVADGGAVMNQVEEYVSVDNPGVLSDRVVDISTEADGRVVSMDKYHETYPEKTDSEKMHRERQIGRLMETDGDKQAWAMKMLLIAVAGIIGALAVVVLGPMLLGGGGGGGGGSVIPLTLGLV